MNNSHIIVDFRVLVPLYLGIISIHTPHTMTIIVDVLVPLYQGIISINIFIIKLENKRVLVPLYLGIISMEIIMSTKPSEVS